MADLRRLKVDHQLRAAQVLERLRCDTVITRLLEGVQYRLHGAVTPEHVRPDVLVPGLWRRICVEMLVNASQLQVEYQFSRLVLTGARTLRPGTCTRSMAPYRRRVDVESLRLWRARSCGVSARSG